MKSIKKQFKLNVLGIFRLETENMTLMEIMLIMSVVIIELGIATVIILKTYALTDLIPSRLIYTSLY